MQPWWGALGPQAKAQSQLPEGAQARARAQAQGRQRARLNATARVLQVALLRGEAV